MPSANFLNRFQAQVRRAPEAHAVQWRGQPLSYRALDDLAHRACGQLSTLPQGPVCVAAIKSPQTLAVLLGCWLSTRPVLLPSVELPKVLLRTLAGRAGCRFMITPATSTDDDPTFTVDPLDVCADAPASVMTHIDADTRLLLTTSGSTGVPKVVPLSPSGVDAFHEWVSTRFGIAPGATVLSYAPLNFDLSLLDVWAALSAGATTALVDSADAAQGAKLATTITESCASVIQGVPLLFQLLAGTQAPRKPSPAVKHVIVTGDALPSRLLPILRELFPHARIFNVYGCTETNNSTLYEIPETRLDARAERLPIGWPLPGVSALLIADDGHVIHGPGVGQLLVSTPFQTAGYLETEMTRDHFVSDPTCAGDAVYFRSGDIVHRDEQGLLRLEGRADSHVKVRGVRTNMAEVEHVLAQHPEVVEVAVVAVTDDRADRRLHAVIRRAPDSELTSLTLRTHCAQRLPRTAIPSTIRLVDQRLPTTPTGKIDRNAIARQT